MVRPLGRASSRFSNKRFSGVAVLMFLACSIQPVSAEFILDEPITGGRLLVVEDGYVTAEFLGSDAGYFNTLYLEFSVIAGCFLSLSTCVWLISSPKKPSLPLLALSFTSLIWLGLAKQQYMPLAT